MLPRLAVALASRRVYPPPVQRGLGLSEGPHVDGRERCVRSFIWCLAFAASLFVAIPGACPATASAQAVPPPVEVATSYKGVVGLGLIGAELGFAVPALAGMDQTWAFIVFPAVGAAGGATAGYFLLEGEGKSVGANVALLATGLALVIPTMVVTLSATAYDPDDEAAIEGSDDDSESGPVQAEDYEVGGGTAPGADAPAGSAPPANEAAPAAPAAEPAAAPAPQSRRMRRGPAMARRSARDPRDTGLVRFNEDGIALGMPAIATLPTYSLEEQVRLGLRNQHTEVRVSLLSATF